MRIDIAVRGTAAAAGASTGLLIAQQAMLPFGGRFTDLVMAVWILTSVTAAQCWLTRLVQRERKALIRLSADLCRRIPDDDRPPLVRSVR